MSIVIDISRESTTEPNTPEPSAVQVQTSEEPNWDFARLIPVSKSSRQSFHTFVSSLQEKHELYEWHSRFVYVDLFSEPLYEAEEESTGAESFSTDEIPTIKTGYWRFNMNLKPMDPRIGWVIGRGRWSAAPRPGSHASVDLLLTGNPTERSIHGKHARFFHHRATNRFIVEASRQKGFNGEVLKNGDRRELPRNPTTLSFDDFSYTFSWTDIDQNLYISQLSALASEIGYATLPPSIITPTPGYSKYMVASKYWILGTFAQGSSCIVSSCTDRNGTPFAVKKMMFRG